MAEEEVYEVFDMRSDRHVGPMRSTASVDAYVNAFRSDLNNDVEGMWLDHDICVVKISGAKYSHCNFADLLGNYVIIETIESYAVEVDHKQAAARLQGFLAEWDEIQVATMRMKQETDGTPVQAPWSKLRRRSQSNRAANPVENKVFKKCKVEIEEEQAVMAAPVESPAPETTAPVMAASVESPTPETTTRNCIDESPKCEKNKSTFSVHR